MVVYRLLPHRYHYVVLIQSHQHPTPVRELLDLDQNYEVVLPLPFLFEKCPVGVMNFNGRLHNSFSCPLTFQYDIQPFTQQNLILIKDTFQVAIQLLQK